MTRACIFACYCLLMACATQKTRWSAFQNHTGGFSNTGQIEYNGIGGSGRQPSPTIENGLGGSGKKPRTSMINAQANGLGGSGRQAPDALQNGLGGSGKTAILGSISAFGSIWVNDRHIQLPDSTDYLIAGHEANRSDLRLGQVVAVLADSIDEQEYQALEVHLLYNVVGMLTQSESVLNLETETHNSSKNRQETNTISKLTVLGQSVLIDQQTRIINPLGEPLTHQQLKAGERLAISGLRMPNQDIKASLIVAQTSQHIRLAGPVSALDGEFWLGQQKLSFDKVPELDQPLRLQGELQDGIFIVNNWAPLPHNRVFNLADEIWLEGIPLSNAELFIEGFEVQLPEFTNDLFDQNESMRVGIDRDNQEFWMDHAAPEIETHWQQNNDLLNHHEFAPSQRGLIDDDFDDGLLENETFIDSDIENTSFEDTAFDDMFLENPSHDDLDSYPQEPEFEFEPDDMESETFPP